MSKSALASLTAQYTDSENEDDRNVDRSPESSNSQTSQVIIPKPISPKKTPERQIIPRNSRLFTAKRRKKALRLVSYQDDTIISDDDGNIDGSSDESEENNENSSATSSAVVNSIKEHSRSKNIDDECENATQKCSVGTKGPLYSAKTEKSEKFAHYGFSLPPEPKGKPSSELLEKIQHLYDKMENTNMDMNRMIQERKEFRNPSIYEKLIQFCDINEFGTNYPPEIYDPLQWGPESYYEELAKVQKNEMVKRQKERKDNDKIEQATALARKVEEEAKKRKSKWDQPAPVKAGVPTALTTTVTGTKGTVISAFGSLPKKPAA